MNPHQIPARALALDGPLPFAVLNGKPGTINLLDALNSWQLVRELRQATGLPAAASFKHVSPAGAAVAVPLDPATQAACFVGDVPLSPLATAFVRARGADRVSSFGDWVALSDPLDLPTARLLRREVSDGIIAPGYEPEALALLCRKQGGNYRVLQIDPDYEPPALTRRDVFGVVLEQGIGRQRFSADTLGPVVTRHTDLPDSARRDMLVAQVALKYTQSNSVCFALDGQIIGMGAGQQSRIHCTRLAAAKAESWWLRHHPRVLALPFREKIGRPERDNAIDQYLLDDLAPVEEAAWQHNFSTPPVRLTSAEKRAWIDQLDGVTLASDAFFPFRDSIDRAARTGVRHVIQPGGSLRDADVTAACDQYGMVMIHTGIRLFHH
jgi:AICAR transformylase/IMP cyclohydrolase PurH